MKQTFTIAIGGAAGQGVATPGDIFAKIFSRRGSAPECLQRLPVDYSRRPHVSHDSHWARASYQHG